MQFSDYFELIQNQM